MSGVVTFEKGIKLGDDGREGMKERGRRRGVTRLLETKRGRKDD